MTEGLQFPRLGVSACVWREGRVLMIQRARPIAGQWSLPGGHVEPGETTLAAAHRELLEETGVEADLTTLVDIYDVIRRDAAGKLTVHYAVACFTGFWRSGEPRGASDALHAEWCEPQRIAMLDVIASVPIAIARARQLLRL